VILVINEKVVINKKGFIGPIGDDIPSLIPLIFALVLFFGVFSYSLNEFDRHNTVFDRSVESSKITAEMRSAAYIQGHDSFQKVCDSLGIKKLKYRAGLVELKIGEEKIEDVYETVNVLDIQFYKDPETGQDFRCTNVEEDASSRSGDYVVVQYPIALQTTKIWSESNPDMARTLDSKFAVRPMVLVIVLWAY